MKYNKPTGLGKLKYLIPASALVFGSCEMVKQPPENAVVLRADYDCLIKDIGSYADIINEWLKGEGQPYGLSRTLAEGGGILGERNPDFRDPYNYDGELNFPDINGDGKFSPKLMKCGHIINPNQQKIVPKYKQQKTIPRPGKS